MSEPSIINTNPGVAGNGSAIGASVVAAGLTGLVGAILMSRQGRKERAQERVEKRVGELEARAEETMAQLNRAIEGLSFDRSGQTRAARKQVKKLSRSASAAADEAVKRAQKRVAEIDKEVRGLKVAERANRLANEGSDRATALSATLSERLAMLVAEARHGLTELGDAASAQASAVAETSAKKARSGAQPVKDEAARLVQDVKSLGADIGTHGAALVADVRQKSPELAERVKDVSQDAAERAREAAPELREKLAEAASKAAERGGEVVARAKERAPEVAGQLKERAPEVQEAVTSSVAATIHDLQEHARPLVSEAGAAAAKAAEQARVAARDAGQAILPEVQHQADAMGERVATTTHAIEHKSKQAASAAGRGTKDFTALALWSAVAGGVAYVALLNEEQQQRVRESGKRVWAEIREVYADIRGYDEEFA